MVKPRRGEDTGLLLVYPDCKPAALGSPGFRQVYRLLSGAKNTIVDWGWYDEQNDSIVFETHEWNGRYATIAFSVPFELLYANVIKALIALDIEPEKKLRSAAAPEIVIGGAAPTINPTVAGVIADTVVSGELETLLTQNDNSVLESSGAAKRLTPMIGITLPISVTAAPDLISPAHLIDSSRLEGFDDPAQCTFEGAGIIEVGRGCSRGCRFCAAGHIYLPARHRKVEDILEDARTFTGTADRIGLVGAAISDHRKLKEIMHGLLDMGFGLTTSSFRADMVDEELASLLKSGGLKTLTIAPEGGSKRIRTVINKRLSEEQILDAAEASVKAGINSLRLYYMVGLPWEERSDINAIVGLTSKIRDIFHGPGKRITVSVNPFIPKPQTPFQWSPMAEQTALKKAYLILKRGFLKMPGVTLKTMSIRVAVKEAVISLGGEQVGCAIVEAVRDNVPWKKSLANNGVDVNNLVHRLKCSGEQFAWDKLSGEKRKAALRASFEKAQQTASTFID
ncbi:radical SAM protein [Candidatus Latescibacterota bacterium]